MSNKSKILKSLVSLPSWNFFSLLLICVYAFFQILRWPLRPQFMDIYYHLHTAWGFLQSGGWSTWDFWEFAPWGRPHIYPPFLHLVLAFFIKLGIEKIFLARLLETVIPVIFIFVLWRFIKNNYGVRLGFLTLLLLGSSFLFFDSLSNYLAATLGLIFGVLCIQNVFKRRILIPALYLSLCFYTHIGVSSFIFLGLFFYGLFDQPSRKIILRILILGIILSLPVLINQIAYLNRITTFGFQLKENNLTRLKIFEYCLAIFALVKIFSKDKKYRLFLALFLASLVYLSYPYRFFSAEGYLPVLLLAAFGLDEIIGVLRLSVVRLRFFCLGALIFAFISPSLEIKSGKINLFDSAFSGVISAKGEMLWQKKEFLATSSIIKDNSLPGDIIYCSIDQVGIILAVLAERRSANALFPEIKQFSGNYDPVSHSDIVVLDRNIEHSVASSYVGKYSLIKIGGKQAF